MAYRRCYWCGKGTANWSGCEQRTLRGPWKPLCFECWRARKGVTSPVAIREIPGWRARYFPESAP